MRLSPADPATIDQTVTRAWRPSVAGIREVFHATFGTHAYPLHTHDVWTLFVVDDGAIRYALDGREHGAGGAGVWILPPHVVHDGRPATDRGFRKRVLYLEPDVIGEKLVGRSVDRPDLADSTLRRAVARLHDALACVDDRLEAETRFALVLERVRAALGAAAPETVAAPPALAEQLRDWLDARLFEPVTIADASVAIAASPTQLARSFRAAFGIPPHAYVTGRRLEAARDRILRGQPLADVAAEVGFHDQAHLSRRFRRFLGTTPGRFRTGAIAN